MARLGALSRGRKLLYGGIATAAIGVCCALIVAAGPGARASNPPARPALARSFSLVELGNPRGRVTLAQYAGQPLIVNFFASWCEPCQRETPLLARFYASSHGRVAMVGIDSNDTATAALRFVRQAKVGYPVGSDPFPAPTATSYRVLALPQTFFLNAQHRVVLHVLGPVTMANLKRGVALMDRSRQKRG
jgi:thiol-disulfide isomerase/thioredoxin